MKQEGSQWYSRAMMQTAMSAQVLQTLTDNPELIPELRSLLMAQAQTHHTTDADDPSQHVSCRMS